jgi:hypothetical protein
MTHRTDPRASPRRLLGILALATLLAPGCTEVKKSPYFAAMTAWPAADMLFTGARTWRGGDAAYSVDLGGGRILWLFGDSFVGDGPDDSRSHRKMVKNTIGIQEGADPAAATMRFHWDDKGPEPGPFFPGESEAWLWPGPGMRIGDAVLLTFMQITKTGEGSFGFECVGSEARFLINPDAAPGEWTYAPVALPPTPAGVKFGTGAFFRDGKDLYAYVVVEPGTHDVYLARWAIADLAAKDLSKATWWTGQSWSSDPTQAAGIVKDVQTEFSVSRGPDGRLWMIAVKGFGKTDIVVRTATAPAGPWSEPAVLFHPPESDRKGDVLVYSAKAYVHDPAQGLAFTYCTNHLDFWTMAGDMSLYFPRFVRLLPSQ